MATRRRFSAREAVELVAQHGSDIENDISDNESIISDSGDEDFVPDDDFGSDSEAEAGENRGDNKVSVWLLFVFVFFRFVTYFIASP